MFVSVAQIDPAFLSQFSSCGPNRMLTNPTARRRQERISRIHTQSAPEFIVSLLLGCDSPILRAYRFDKCAHRRRHYVRPFRRDFRHPCHARGIAIPGRFSEHDLNRHWLLSVFLKAQPSVANSSWRPMAITTNGRTASASGALRTVLIETIPELLKTITPSEQ